MSEDASQLPPPEDEKPEQPNQQPAEELGAAALHEGPVEDADLAHGLADAEHSQRAMEQIAQNLESSGLPKSEIEELQRTIHEKGQELADRAAQEYEQAQARYTAAKDKVLGALLSVAEGKIDPNEEVELLDLPLGHIARYEVGMNQREDEFGTADLTTGQQQKLKQIVLTASGVREPNVSEYLKKTEYVFDQDAVGIATAADSPLGFRLAFIYRLRRRGVNKVRDAIDDDGMVKSSELTGFKIVKIPSEGSVEDYSYSDF